VNSQGRVSELRLSNGGKFIRQADGSYQYKK
jgi:opacity-associated protein oapA